MYIRTYWVLLPLPLLHFRGDTVLHLPHQNCHRPVKTRGSIHLDGSCACAGCYHCLSALHQLEEFGTVCGGDVEGGEVEGGGGWRREEGGGRRVEGGGGGGWREEDEEEEEGGGRRVEGGG